MIECQQAHFDAASLFVIRSGVAGKESWLLDGDEGGETEAEDVGESVNFGIADDVEAGAWVRVDGSNRKMFKSVLIESANEFARNWRGFARSAVK